MSILYRSGVVAVTRSCAIGMLFAFALNSGARADDETVAGEVIVQLRPQAVVGPLLSKYRLTLAGRFGSRPIYRLKVIGSASVPKAIEALSREPDVVHVQPNTVHESPEARKNVVWAIGNAANYSSQWGLESILLSQAHRLSTGAGVRIAVLDTGVDQQHPALAGRLLPGFDFVDFDDDPSEAGSVADRGYGHGTHVAGLLARVAPGAKIMPLRVLDAAGKGNTWVLAEAMLHAVDPDGDPTTDDGAHVINLSLGTLRETRIFETVAKFVGCKSDDDDDDDDGAAPDRARCDGFGGAVVVAAAGNDGNDYARQFPAGESNENVLPVGASDRNGRRARFSNYGWVKIAAPGDGITSTVPGGGYGTWSGTSMATPLAAGAAALVRAAHPHLPVKDVVDRITSRSRDLCNESLKQIDLVAAIIDDSPSGDGKVPCR